MTTKREVVSTADRMPTVKVKREVILSSGRRSQVTEIRPAAQEVVHDQQDVWSQQVLLSPPSNMFQTNAIYRATLYRGRFTRIDSMALQIVLTTAGAVTAAPVANWFSRIEFKSSGNTQSLHYCDGEAEIQQFCLLNEGQRMQGLMKNALFNSDARFSYGPSGSRESGATITAYLPLYGRFWHCTPFYFANLQNDIVVEFTPQPGGILIAGSSSNVSVSSMSLIINSEQLSGADSVYQSKLFNDYSHAVDYLRPTVLYNNSATLTAGSRYLFDLSALRGKTPFLTVAIRASGATNATNGLFNYQTLGDQGASIDWVDSGGASLWGGGAPMDAKFLRNHIGPHHFNNDFTYIKPLYVVPFTNNIKKAFCGVRDGYSDFVASFRTNLAITPAPALTAEVHTITLSAAAASGDFRLKWKNSETDPLAFGTSTANLAVAFNALDDALRDGVTAAFSATFSAGTTVTVTYSQNYRYNGPSSLIQFHNESAASSAPAAIQGVTTRTTANNEGFTTGTYDIIVCQWRYVNLVSLAGEISVQDSA